jgi:hypothetical protein
MILDGLIQDVQLMFLKRCWDFFQSKQQNQMKSLSIWETESEF